MHGRRAEREPELGAVVIEGLAAMALLFLVLVLVVEAAFLVTARNAASAAAADGARSLARPGADSVQRLAAVRATIERTIPGATDVEVGTTDEWDVVAVTVRFRWLPPGPDLVPAVVTVTARAHRIEPP